MKTTVNLSDSVMSDLKMVYGKYENQTTIISHALESFAALQKRVKTQLKGVFTQNELLAIIDNLNGTMFQADFMTSKEMFLHHLQDGNSFEGLYQKWEIDVKSFEAKINALDNFSAFFLQEWAMRFWNFNHRNLDLNTYVAELC